MKTRNVFIGKNSIRNFLNPDKNPPIPLVELPEQLNPFRKDKVRVYAKLMNMLPLGNVKSLPALNMLLEAEKNGKLRDVESLIENSSGNTVFSLATIARFFGIEKTKAIVSHEVTWGKLQLLRLFGTEAMVNEEPICPDPKDKESGIWKAREVGGRKGWFNPGQYENEANPRAHAKWTAPQIWNQTRGKITVFCAGAGTTGTLVGVGEYLKKKKKSIAIVGVARAANNPVPGVRTKNLLREIAFDWKRVVDHMEEKGSKESFRLSVALCRAGLVAGPSSGFALAGLYGFLEKKKKEEGLDSLRNREGEVVAVFICPDSPLPYLSEYFEYLDESDFPSIENEHLLINKPERSVKKEKVISASELGIETEEAYDAMYAYSIKELWEHIDRRKNIRLKDGLKLIDVRTPEEYRHAHLPGSKNIDHKEALKDIEVLSQAYKRKKVMVICRSGRRSFLVAEALRKRGIEAWNMEGGMIEWSRLNLPRVRPQICKTL